MINVVASARPVFDPALHTLTFALPVATIKGDALFAVIVHAAASSVTVPAGWTDMGATTAGGETLRRIGRMADDREPTTIAVTVGNAGGDEIQGSLIVLRGAGTIPLIVESSASSTFAATLAPASPAISALQAIDLMLEVWSCAGAATLGQPAGFYLVDMYSTAIVAARTVLVAQRRANATGALAFGAASSDVNATGAAFAFALRDSLPIQPLGLVDLVPGNIGLLGRDARASNTGSTARSQGV